MEEKLRIVAETEQAGAKMAEIARQYEISRELLWNWRSQARRGAMRPEPSAMSRCRSLRKRLLQSGGAVPNRLRLLAKIVRHPKAGSRSRWRTARSTRVGCDVSLAC